MSIFTDGRRDDEMVQTGARVPPRPREDSAATESVPVRLTALSFAGHGSKRTFGHHGARGRGSTPGLKSWRRHGRSGAFLRRGIRFGGSFGSGLPAHDWFIATPFGAWPLELELRRAQRRGATPRGTTWLAKIPSGDRCWVETQNSHVFAGEDNRSMSVPVRRVLSCRICSAAS